MRRATTTASLLLGVLLLLLVAAPLPWGANAQDAGAPGAADEAAGGGGGDSNDGSVRRAASGGGGGTASPRRAGVAATVVDYDSNFENPEAAESEVRAAFKDVVERRLYFAFSHLTPQSQKKGQNNSPQTHSFPTSRLTGVPCARREHPAARTKPG